MISFISLFMVSRLVIFALVMRNYCGVCKKTTIEVTNDIHMNMSRATEEKNLARRSSPREGAGCPQTGVAGTQEYEIPNTGASRCN